MKRKSKNKNIILNGFIVLSVLFNLFLLGFYLKQTGDLTENGYLIRDSQKTIRQTSKEAVLALSDLKSEKSFCEIEKRALAMGFVKSNDIVYIPEPEKHLSLTKTGF